MDIDWITQQLKTKNPTTPPIHYYPEVDSTNSAGKRCLATQTSPYFILAAQQSAGRGRLGRTFLSPAETGVYLTYVFKSPLARLQPGLLTTSAAVITAQSIQQVFHVEPAIKWVNDLYFNQHKVCGILAESVPLTATDVAIVLGIGINLQTPTALPTDLTAKVGGLDVPGNINALVVDLLAHLPELSQRYQTGVYLPYYRQHAFLTGKYVTLKLGDQLQSGYVQDVDDTGALILKTATGLQKFTAGEVQKVRF